MVCSDIGQCANKHWGLIKRLGAIHLKAQLTEGETLDEHEGLLAHLMSFLDIF